MKYFFRILLTLILAGITVFTVYYFTNGRTLPGAAEKAVVTTLSKAQATEKYANKRLLSTDKTGDYKIYVTNDSVLLGHGKEIFEFKSFGTYFELEKPKITVFDIDGDQRRDVIVRGVSGEEQGTGDFVYDIYIFIRNHEDKEGYTVLTASQDLWHKILDEAIIEEITQLKDCKKCVQFAMTLEGTHIEYDEKTGIVTKNPGYVGYFRALQDKNGKYLTVDTWNKGKGSFFINKYYKLCCEVEVLVKYKDSDAVQKAGTVYFELHMKDGALKITNRTMVFNAAEDCVIAKPTDTAKNPWSRTVKNSASPKGSEAINWLKYSFAVDNETLTKTVDLAKEDTDIKFVNSIVISEGSLVMTAKNGYTFDSKTAEKNEFSVIINRNTEDEYEISYLAEVSEDGKTLKINFDKTYPLKKVKTVYVSFGSK